MLGLCFRIFETASSNCVPTLFYPNQYYLRLPMYLINDECAINSSNTNTQRAKDNSNLGSKAKRSQVDHSTRDVVMFLDASEIKQTMFFWHNN